jgi:hypothetical protein
MNPYQKVAKTILAAIAGMEGEEREKVLAIILAQAATKAQDGMRSRIAKLTIPLTFDRYQVEHLDNYPHYMQIEMAKALGLAILQNDAVCELSREQSDTDVKFTASVALVPKADWEP